MLLKPNLEKKLSRKSGSEIRFYGASVSEGIAIGKPYFLKPVEDEIPDFEISHGEVDHEVARYRKALFSSKEDLTKLREDLEMEGSDEAVSTIETHIQMLDDPMITTHMEGKIRQMLRNTESVFHSVINDYESRFSERTDAFFQERLLDVKDISKRILGHLSEKGVQKKEKISKGSVVFTNEITPSYTASAHPGSIGAVVTREGGGNSHAALIARSKGIPYLAGIDVEEIEALEVREVIIDAFEGLLIVNPTSKTLASYREKQQQLATRYQRFLDEDHLRPETQDGYPIKLLVNVGSTHDLDCFPYKHEGVGLFRTEYLFLETQEFYPSEEYQEAVYSEMIQKMEGRCCVIRVFDLGGDKNPGPFLTRQREANPVMGNRGIRFLLRNPNIFKTQLRAVFKAASIEGSCVQLLLPLISDIGELQKSKEIIASVQSQLRKEGYLAPDLKLGCMIEVPSAVMICDALATECDFLSMGTNDLVQYTLGVDRDNPLMSELYYPAHPSVLRMIKMISLEAKRKNKEVTICGEIASNTLFTPLLLGLGLSHFSVSPRYIPLIKQTARKWTIIEAYQLADKILTLSDPKEISAYLTENVKN